MSKEPAKKAKHPGGRPTDYTKERGDLICERVATHSLGLPKLCTMYSDMPNESTIYQWRHRHPEFNQNYTHAKMKQADLLAEQCLTIADESTNEDYCKTRLRIDTRKWLASKLLPKQYGDKLLVEQKNEEEEELKDKRRTLRKTLDERNKKDY